MRANRKSKASAKRPRKTAATTRRAAQRAGKGPSSDAILAELRQRLAEISDLNAAGAVLGWDEATYMPPGGALARGRQSALLRRLAHERFVDPALGRAIDRLEPLAASLAPADASLIRVVRRDFAKAAKVPADYVA